MRVARSTAFSYFFCFTKTEATVEAGLNHHMFYVHGLMFKCVDSVPDSSRSSASMPLDPIWSCRTKCCSYVASGMPHSATASPVLPPVLSSRTIVATPCPARPLWMVLDLGPASQKEEGSSHTPSLLRRFRCEIKLSRIELKERLPCLFSS
ncbi:hypothetical protein CONLIGDRAFT_468141 [Coniochaeta ligniaria NRRL 30616]|uniref:Uncharacterized protein n=1 Tax=Coniochaeta ligniaria NRRL 30616 TaxID=1408157 RepID=A0A1J7JFA4_9PEZI|nr:hypothetical protein CONLIGDRAFT_468141 [Coniochaeta ligniaria NRRL 30616]